SELLCAVLELPAEQRATWLDTLAPQHAMLRAGLAKVIAQASILDGTPYLSVPHLPDAALSDWQAGQCVGPYILERQLGRGGMAEVWLAARGDGTLDRHVALKLPHGHLLAGPLRQRFERERDILAALSHPHIAPLYDAGISTTGYPYLAMEWIEGVPITGYCRERNLPISWRLGLFEQVLDAVNYAHARLIAHRDLKPSNILVTADGEVKLLDFGIAKLLGGETAGMVTELTQFGGRAVTPGYAAPEQIAGLPITTAVDVYALGVLLFELLTGERPFDAGRADHMAVHEAPLASKRVAEEQARCMSLPAAAHLRRLLRGDLDAITAKALEIDPGRRYGSAAAFADDIARYRRHEPISARRIGKLMLLMKVVRRHRLASALGAGLLLALFVGSIGIAWEAVHAQRAARFAEDAALRAQSEARRAKTTKDFLVSVFKASDPRIAPDKPRGTITAKELLDISAERIQTEFAQDPETAIELLGTLADIYIVLDETEHALALLRQQADLALEHDGPLSTTLINALLLQADAESSLSHYDRSLRALSRADESMRQASLDHSAYRAWWWYEKAAALSADPLGREQRATALENAVALYGAVAPRDPIFPHALSDLGAIYFSRNDFPRARDYLRRAITLDESGVNPDEAHLSALYSNLGKLLMSSGELESAFEAFQRAGAMSLKAFGSDSRFYWTAIAHGARALDLLGERKRALDMFHKLMPLLPAKSYRNAEEEQAAARVNEVYGSALLADGLAGTAVPVFKIALAEFAEAKQDSSSELRVRGLLAQAYARLGRVTEARSGLQEVLHTLSSTLKPSDARVLNARQVWGAFLLDQGQLSEAEQHFDEVLKSAPEATAAVVALSLGGKAQIAIARHQTAAALTLSLNAIDGCERVVGFRDVRMAPRLWRIRAEALLQSADTKGALVWAQRALDANRRYDDPASPDIAAAETTLKKIVELDSAR
ncbi:MAG TPA: protein kinase, partial [Steroidobacteraceae bacterium]